MSKGNSEEKKARKQRSDKGLVMATDRDLLCIAWLADQYAVRADQIRRLLSRFPDKDKPFKDGRLMAETTAKDQINRWRRAGWIEHLRVLHGQPGWAWVTKKGLALVGRDDLYTARVPASTRLNHLYAINQLRLWMDARYAWKSERRYRAEQSAFLLKGMSLGPIPDGLIVTQRGLVAVEVEISAKKPGEIAAKLARLVRHYDSTLEHDGPVFTSIWFYVPNEQIKRLVEVGVKELRDDEQGRVSVVVEGDLIASRFR